MKLSRSIAPLLVALACFASAAFAADHPVIPLWPDGAPGSAGKTAPEKIRIGDAGDHIVSSVHQPTLTVYLPEKSTATGAGVLVIPGGGHREIWMDHEGYNVAQWLADHGIAAFILKYRLAREPGSTYRVEVESLQDTQRALRLIHSRTAAWSLDPARVGVIGFSAGGELAALVSLRHDAGRADAADPVERASCRPAFQALIYPGNSAAIVPTKNSPPAFLACGSDDRADISEGLAKVYLLFKQAGVPAEIHIYAGVSHGFGIRPTNTGAVATWPDRFREWLVQEKFLGSKPK